ncbi:hypothetical protein MLD38_031270 [Melastoma candidum]|uniref:Uncharacterized protein n=1 Tax=Melastoma candidum TaxID=119954 RepID=A0ACB9MPP8_9MYRT|nr:hypothetical protein MLD38_031270 [Melastoma candidum]
MKSKEESPRHIVTFFDHLFLLLGISTAGWYNMVSSKFFVLLVVVTSDSSPPSASIVLKFIPFAVECHLQRDVSSLLLQIEPCRYGSLSVSLSRMMSGSGFVISPAFSGNLNLGFTSFSVGWVDNAWNFGGSHSAHWSLCDVKSSWSCHVDCTPTIGNAIKLSWMNHAVQLDHDGLSRFGLEYAFKPAGFPHPVFSIQAPEGEAIVFTPGCEAIFIHHVVLWALIPVVTLSLSSATPASSSLQGGTVDSTTTFKIINKCRHTIWPGLLSGATSPPLPTTGFSLPSGRSFSAPTSWSGRICARTLY